MKHIELFENGFDETIIEKIKPENCPYIGYSPIEGFVFTVVPKLQPNNEIWYTSTDGNIVTLYPYYCVNDAYSNYDIISNAYSDKGVMKLSVDITTL
jgi:hypothetical protein